MQGKNEHIWLFWVKLRTADVFRQSHAENKDVSCTVTSFFCSGEDAKRRKDHSMARFYWNQFCQGELVHQGELQLRVENNQWPMKSLGRLQANMNESMNSV